MRIRAFAFAAAALGLFATEAVAAGACRWAGMRSAGSNEARELVVVNQVGDRSARLYWIDFDGQPRFYAEIPPWGRHVQQTYRGHVWVSENSYGYCDVIFTVENNVEIVIK